jgi:hypothetical protein
MIPSAQTAILSKAHVCAAKNSCGGMATALRTGNLSGIARDPVQEYQCKGSVYAKDFKKQKTSRISRWFGSVSAEKLASVWEEIPGFNFAVVVPAFANAVLKVIEPSS